MTVYSTLSQPRSKIAVRSALWQCGAVMLSACVQKHSDTGSAMGFKKETKNMRESLPLSHDDACWRRVTPCSFPKAFYYPLKYSSPNINNKYIFISNRKYIYITRKYNENFIFVTDTNKL